jgi:hypothetical protein
MSSSNGQQHNSTGSPQSTAQRLRSSIFDRRKSPPGGRRSPQDRLRDLFWTLRSNTLSPSITPCHRASLPQHQSQSKRVKGLQRQPKSQATRGRTWPDREMERTVCQRLLHQYQSSKRCATRRSGCMVAWEGQARTAHRSSGLRPQVPCGACSHEKSRHLT